MESDLRICTRCVMDESDRDIQFDEDGVCNYCRSVEPKVHKFRFSEEEERRNLEEIRSRVLKRKSGDYDCIIGLSGGVDSTYLVYLAVEVLDIKPLIVHFDNGWNSDIAVSNIHKIVSKYDLDLHTHVVDWEEFRSLQLAFLKASVVDVELLTDQAIQAVLYKVSKKYKVSTTLSGGNFRTEHGMPPSWFWSVKQDVANIKDIFRQFGDGTRIRTYPFLTALRQKSMQKLGYGLYSIQPFDMINYDKSKATEVLKSIFDWQEYGGKHKESTWTAFYQDYYLLKKFNIDKRRVHLSALIRFGDLDRDAALKELQDDVAFKAEQSGIVDYVKKKLVIADSEFEKIMKSPRVEHDTFASESGKLATWQDRYHRIRKIWGADRQNRR